VKRSLLAAFVAFVLLFGACRFIEELTGSARTFTLTGDSMAPTFCTGDVVRVESFDGELERWQVVAFKFPWDLRRQQIKRVVGLPGETIEVRTGGDVYIDGEWSRETFIPQRKPTTWSSRS
jgi:signal peptidase I